MEICDYYQLPTIYWSPFLKQLFAACILRHIRINSPVSGSDLREYAHKHLRSEFPAKHRRMNQDYWSGLSDRTNTALRYLVEQGAVLKGRRGVPCVFTYVQDIPLGTAPNNPEVEYLREVLKAYQRDGKIRETIFTRVEECIHALQRNHPKHAEIILRQLEQLKELKTSCWWDLDSEIRDRGVDIVLKEYRQRSKSTNETIVPTEIVLEEIVKDLKISLRGECSTIRLNTDGSVVVLSHVCGQDYVVDESPFLNEGIEDIRKQLAERKTALSTEIHSIDEALKDLQSTADRVRKMAAADSP